ncbi:uncharacterized protein LOC101847530 isoform X2 [Aplysia californica]|nr:uncharacterized protein LOC101847530 isoform X2 [Aplysia californica]XP_012943987.1 uncharacterized protein LOC101847530 isoform X2 [Aplysia californica]
MQGNHSLHVFGSKVASDVDTNASNVVQLLKQELSACQADNKKLTDQLNCLISLIKRSWTGDRHATIHLSNIVGLEPPKQGMKNDGTIARPNSQVQTKTKNECHWERFALKLLERDYQAVQAEIKECQQRYLENRQLYMEAVLQDHQQSMSRIPLHRNTDSALAMEDVDSKIIRHNKALQRMGVSKSRNPRAQSAVTRRKPSLEETVDQMEISLRELVGDTPSSNHFVTAQAPRTITPCSHSLRRPMSSTIPGRLPNTYNDPTRYTQNNLFGLGESDPVKKPRPVSASSLRDGDNIRSRPRSGNRAKPNGQPAFITQRNERPLKYETTRPVSSKPRSAKQRRNSDGVPVKRVQIDKRPVLISQTDVIHASSGWQGQAGQDSEDSSSPQRGQDSPHKNGGRYSPHDDGPNYDHDGFDSEGADFENLHSKPPMAVRVKSASVRRPAFIDEFANDEQAMKDMENDFKKTALSLQKKLGINDTGIVSYD